MKNIFKRLREWFSPADPIPGEIWGFKTDHGNPFPGVTHFKVIAVENNFVQYENICAKYIDSTKISTWHVVYRKIKDAPAPARDGGGPMI